MEECESNEGHTLPPSGSQSAPQQDSALEGGLNFVDFTPQLVKKKGVFADPIYEPFGTLVSKANDWLKKNTDWAAKTCETVDLRIYSGKIETESMTFTKKREFTNRYIMCLRIWVVPRLDKSRSPQQISYCNLVPQQIDKGGLFKSPTWETLDRVLAGYNEGCRTKPPPGRILTIETHEMKFQKLDSFDPDITYWREDKGLVMNYLFIVRLFCEATPSGVTGLEEIGMADFVPRMLVPGGLFSMPMYEPFPSVVAQASSWCSQQVGIRFCNSQSVNVLFDNSTGVGDPVNVYYTEMPGENAYFLQILRVGYVKSNSAPQGIPAGPPLQLSYKTFAPNRLTKEGVLASGTFESMSVTKERIDTWLAATGAQVQSCETMRMSLAEGSPTPLPDVTFSSNRNSSYHSEWILIVRIFLDGVYGEPSSDKLPPVPAVKQENCSIQ